MKLPKFLPKPSLQRLTSLALYLPVLKLRVRENSMTPTLNPGDLVLVFRFIHGRRGDIVVFRRNHILMIKRVSRVERGKYYLLGDNPRNSLDSRRFGVVSKKEIVGVVFSTMTKKS